MQSLERALPFGQRKYQQFLYCGMTVRQHQPHVISIDQEPYIEKLTPMAHKHLHRDKKIPSSEVTNLKGLVGSLAWAAVNTRPDIGFDVSWLASKGENATGTDVAFGNKIMKNIKAIPLKLWYIKVTQGLDNIRLVSFHDAGWATRPSLHSQAGGRDLSHQ
jgi:hypothetical protein